jgi:hypothetical protein
LEPYQHEMEHFHWATLYKLLEKQTRMIPVTQRGAITTCLNSTPQYW